MADDFTDETDARWRLILGQQGGEDVSLDGHQLALDRTLEALYQTSDQERGQGSLQDSAPAVSRWLGDIREYFPTSVVQMMQKDAISRLHLEQLLLEPEVLETVQADVELVATLISLNHVIPAKTKETATAVIDQVVQQVRRKLEQKTIAAVSGAVRKSQRTLRPRQASDINWNATIAANLPLYQPQLGTIIPEKLIGYGRARQSLYKHLILCVDQSGSMAQSVVYSSIFAAVLASIPSLRTSLVLFDTAVVDCTEKLQDPLDVLFGAQLGGGTDINQALRYSSQLIVNANQTVVVLISDLLEGGNQAQMRAKAQEIIESGSQLVVLLALSDDGAPYYDKENAQFFADLGAPAFACTPDKFPDLIAEALSRK